MKATIFTLIIINSLLHPTYAVSSSLGKNTPPQKECNISISAAAIDYGTLTISMLQSGEDTTQKATITVDCEKEQKIDILLNPKKIKGESIVLNDGYLIDVVVNESTINDYNLKIINDTGQEPSKFASWLPSYSLKSHKKIKSLSIPIKVELHHPSDNNITKESVIGDSLVFTLRNANH